MILESMMMSKIEKLHLIKSTLLDLSFPSLFDCHTRFFDYWSRPRGKMIFDMMNMEKYEQIYVRTIFCLPGMMCITIHGYIPAMLGETVLLFRAIED